MLIDKDYTAWLTQLKNKIRASQLKAAVAVNSEMIQLYWDIGADIAQKQLENRYGSGIIKQLAKDLRKDLPNVAGFSQANLYVMRKFYLFYRDKKNLQQLAIKLQKANNKKSNSNLQQLAVKLSKNSILLKIPWWHHQVILTNCKEVDIAVFYIEQTIANNWSRNILQMQIENKLHERIGKANNNFEHTLPKPASDLARETLKDPYKFDFLTLEADIQELELEKQLTDNITQFLLELGKGFAFVGRQFPVQVGKKERKVDLLFYHTKLHCYIVIDLKMGEFEPEHAGKMNYYLSIIDEYLKTEEDKPSIGIILCKQKDSIDVEFALRDINKPLGISEFSFNELPDNIKPNLPTVSEIENELMKMSK
jgi:predicted nuclease of restriction endonuclease-like (RecB) superfamily